MTEQDKRHLKGIIDSTSLVNAFYDRLYNLEISGKKDSEDYYWSLKALQVTLDELNDKYKNANLDYDKCLIWTKCVRSLMPEELSSNYESIATQEKKNKALRRVLNHLYHMLDFNYKDHPNTNSSYDTICVMTSLEKEIYLSYLTFLKDSINQKIYKHLRDNLILSKYYAVFLNEEAEKDMVANNFDIFDTLTLESQKVAQNTRITDEMYNDLKNETGMMMFTEQMQLLLNLGDFEYGTDRNVVTSVLSQTLIKTSFLLMDEDYFSSAKEGFENFINSSSYLELHEYDRISKEIIRNSFNSFKNEKEKIKILSKPNE